MVNFPDPQVGRSRIGSKVIVQVIRVGHGCVSLTMIDEWVTHFSADMCCCYKKTRRNRHGYEGRRVCSEKNVRDSPIAQELPTAIGERSCRGCGIVGRIS